MDLPPWAECNKFLVILKLAVLPRTLLSNGTQEMMVLGCQRSFQMWPLKREYTQDNQVIVVTSLTALNIDKPILPRQDQFNLESLIPTRDMELGEVLVTHPYLVRTFPTGIRIVKVWLDMLRISNRLMDFRKYCLQGTIPVSMIGPLLLRQNPQDLTHPAWSARLA